MLANDDPRGFCGGIDPDPLIRSDPARVQNVLLSLKYSSFPVVAALHGRVFGAGLQLALYADAIVAHAELRSGTLEQPGVFATGGCAELLHRSAGAAPAFAAVFHAAPTGSAEEPRDRGLLRSEDEIVMRRALLLPAAKGRALSLADAYAPPSSFRIPAAGSAARGRLTDAVRAAVEAGTMTRTDLEAAERIAFVLTGGDAAAGQMLSERDYMALERDAPRDDAMARSQRRP